MPPRARNRPLLLKQWITVVDERTTMVCLDLAGAIMPVDEPFEALNGYHDAPPAHHWCRAGIIAWLSGMVNDQRKLANAEIRRRPAKEKRRGPDGFEGRVPPPVRGPGARRPVVFADAVTRKRGEDSRIDPEQVRTRRRLAGDTDRITFQNGTRAVLKKRDRDTVDREELAGEVARVLDVRVPEAERLSRTELLVHVDPSTTLPELDDYYPGMVDAAMDVDQDQAVRLGVLDILTANVGRHGGSVAVDTSDPEQPELVSVEHEATWPEEVEFEDLVDHDDSETFASWLWDNRRRLLVGLPWVAWRVMLISIRPRFDELGQTELWSAMMARFVRLEEAARAGDQDR